MSILNQLLTTKYKHNSKVCYLYKTKGNYKVDVAKEEDLPRIISDLNVEVFVPDNSKKKLKAYLEDSEGALFFNSILSKDNRERVKPIVFENGLGAENYVQLINKGVSEFKDNLIILDGDKKYKQKNIVVLPGSDSPEKVFFTYLKSLHDSDDFWGELGGYTKQVCFKSLTNIGNRDHMKKWFNEQLPNWGNRGSKLFSRWKKDNATLIDDFNVSLTKAIESLL